MKTHITFLACIILSSFAIAQSGPSFGIKAGLSSASIKGDAVNSLNQLIDYTNGIVTTKSRIGFFAGINTAIPLTESISLQPGFYYNQKGYAMNGSLNLKGLEFMGANTKVELNSNYIDLPVLVKLNIKGVEVFAGPQISYLLKANLRTTAGVLGLNLLNKTIDATSQLNRWDAGFTGGLGYKFSNGINISAAYDHGLIRTDANQNFNAYNRSFKIGIGIDLR